MSKKSDSDNHANQLNPNNSAYWSSRAGQEDDGDWESGGRGYSDLSRGVNPNPLPQLIPCERQFWIDIVELSGRVHCFEVTCKGRGRGLDAEDAAEKWAGAIAHRIHLARRAPGANVSVPLAMQRVTEAGSKEALLFATHIYRPGQNRSIYGDARSAEHDRLWRESGEGAVRKALANTFDVSRYDLGCWSHKDMTGLGSAALSEALRRVSASI